jgi:hypothetical protein
MDSLGSQLSLIFFSDIFNQFLLLININLLHELLRGLFNFILLYLWFLLLNFGTLDDLYTRLLIYWWFLFLNFNLLESFHILLLNHLRFLFFNYWFSLLLNRFINFWQYHLTSLLVNARFNMFFFYQTSDFLREDLLNVFDSSAFLNIFI